MRRVLHLGLVALTGLAAGALVGLALPAASDDPDPAPSPPTAVTAPPVDREPTDHLTDRAAGTRSPSILVWTTGGLPAGLGPTVAALPEVARTTVVAGDLVTAVEVLGPDGRRQEQPPAGLVLGLDAIAVDPTTYPPFARRADRRLLRGLVPGEALVGATSAALHGLSRGDRVVLDNGSTVRVVGVVADQSVGAAELVLPLAGGPRAGVRTPRHLLARPTSESSAAAAAIRALPTDRPRRVRVEGETPYLRSSDAVLPEARIEATFGSWAYARGPGDEVRPDPAWVTANIVTADVPILGEVRCHRALIPALRGAMTELVEQNLAGLIQTYDGCYNPRTVAGGDSISRHAWGAAVDLNFGGNRTGAASIQDDRLVEIMARWGFASGDGWLVPDPGHFEYVAPPRA